ncbi:MAG: hypothetical protein K1X95_03550 [Acidimicrobiia bacterium]|nr:hypothetical protein [Acidimicrobiia bacterium]
MDEVSAGAEVHRPTVGAVDPVRFADEVVAEAEYEEARLAWLADPSSPGARDDARDAAARLAAARAARRNAGDG